MAERSREKSLLKWLKEGGASFEQLELRHRPDGEREVCAARAIERGAPVLALPPALLINLDRARESELGRRVAELGAAADGEDTELAIFLSTQPEGSFFRPYIDSLPASLANFPIFFDQADLDELRGSQVFELALERRGILAAEHARLARELPELMRVSAEEFTRARTLVLSRNFTLSVAGRKLRSLVPLADMCNHAVTYQARWEGTEDGGFAMTAVEAVNPGAVVHDSYGHKCNSRYFLNYGFTLDDNDLNNRARLRLAAPVDPRKRRLLDLGPGDAWRDFRVSRRYNDPTTRELFAFLRVVCADDDELAEAVSRPLLEPLSVANERRVLGALESSCAAALGEFPTTVDEDDRLLAKGGLARNRRSAIVLRRGEKHVLRALSLVAQLARPLFAERWAALSQRPSAEFGEASAYVHAAVLPALRDDPWASLASAERAGHRLDRIPVR